jgi:hypothetical protein
MVNKTLKMIMTQLVYRIHTKGSKHIYGPNIMIVNNDTDLQLFEIGVLHLSLDMLKRKRQCFVHMSFFNCECFNSLFVI